MYHFCYLILNEIKTSKEKYFNRYLRFSWYLSIFLWRYI